MGRKADEDGTNTGGSKTGFGKVGNFRPILGDQCGEKQVLFGQLEQ